MTNIHQIGNSKNVDMNHLGDFKEEEFKVILYSGNGSGGGKKADYDEDEFEIENQSLQNLRENIKEQLDEDCEMNKNSENKEHNAFSNMGSMEKEQAKDKLENNIKTKTKELDDTDFENTVIGSSDIEHIVDIKTVSEGEWKYQYFRLLENALGVSEEHNPHKPSRRVEDVFGTPVITRDLKNIVLALDYSGSMGEPKFRQSLKHTETFLRNVEKQSNPIFTTILWGGHPNQGGFIVKELESVEAVREFLYNKGEGQWSTEFRFCLQYLKSKMWEEPDSVIVFTDGEFTDGYVCEDGREYVNEYMERFLWVLTKDGSLRCIEEYDNNVRIDGRYIKQEG